MLNNSDKTTIHSVAKEAGVSISTVSRVINGLDRVAPSTRHKVEQAVRKLKFYPNSRAQALSRQRTDMIGLLVPDFGGQYFTMLMEGAYEQAVDYGINIMVIKAKGAEAKINAVTRLRAEGRTDGVILMLDELHDKVLEVVRQDDQPLVILDKDVEHRRIDNILVDNLTGAFEATMHMLDVHRVTRMFFVGGPKINVDTTERAQGFANALKSVGMEIDGSLFYAKHYAYDNGYSVAKNEIIPLITRGELSGVVAANDELACGIIDALVESGIQVPQEVGVIGFDDSQLAVRRKLKLTTMRIPMKEIGRAAVRMIMNQLDDNAVRSGPSKLILKAELVVRNSCGCGKHV